MRYPVIPIGTLMTPASALAHTRPHDAMGPVEVIVHLLGQHHAPLLAGTFIAALLLIGGLRNRRGYRTPQHTGIDRNKRQR